MTAIFALLSSSSKTFSASAIGYYGDRGDQLLDEESPPGGDFLTGVCREWEVEAHRAVELGVRVVTVRIGIVLAPEGGELGNIITPFMVVGVSRNRTEVSTPLPGPPAKTISLSLYFCNFMTSGACRVLSARSVEKCKERSSGPVGVSDSE